MKFSLFIISVALITHVCFSESGKITGIKMETQVRSNTFHKEIPVNKFAVRGYIRQMYGNHPIKDAIVTNSTESLSAVSDSLGYFQLMFPMTDTAIYCYKIGLNEIIFKGEFKSQHLMEVDFYLQDPAVPVICTKPVVYAYNAASTFKMTIKPHGGFTFTYPKSNGDWELKTNHDGSVSDVNTNKNYPYIFWEGEGKDLDIIVERNTVEGFLIKTDTCISFLENTLAKIGFNEKEAADFITWWGPQIVQKDYAFLQFLETERYATTIAEIDVAPNPESVLRVYMYLMPLNSDELNFKIVEPQFKKFERIGFTVVEWGGSVINRSETL